MKKRFEYTPEKLTGDSSRYFVIPSSVILDSNMDTKRVVIFSYFSIRRGLDNKFLFSINNMIQWSGATPDGHKGAMNSKYLNVVNQLVDKRYLMYSGNLKAASYAEGVCNLEKISEECVKESRFAVLYLDELNKILQYKKLNIKNAYLNSAVILLVFSYLRMKIYRRRNQLMPEEINIKDKNGNCSHKYDIEYRRLNSPDAYNCYYSDMAKELGITPRTASKAVNILNELGLIYSEALPRKKYDDKWITDHTIFCNTYKRESDELLVSGEEYYRTEVLNKKYKLGILNKNNK